jgi:hypothetical protein
MQKINSESELRAAIVQLEIKQDAEGKILKEEFFEAYENIKPINLIRSTLVEVTESSDIKDHLLNTSVAIATGYISKILFDGITHNPLRKLLGTALQFGVTTVIAKNPEAVKAVGIGVLKIVSTGVQAAQSGLKKNKEPVS